MRVAIVGAGITGLAAAHRLVAEGGGQVEVRVFEASDRVGGKIGTEEVDGFLLEAGADTFLARKPEGIALSECLGLSERIISTRPETRRSFVARAGRLQQIPEGMSGLVPGRLGPLFRSNLLTLPARLRAGAEGFVRSKANEDETVAAFVSRRFGRQVYDRLIEPLICGIVGGDGEKLSVHAAAPALVALERVHGSVLRAVWRESRSQESTRTGFVSFERGMSELTGRLAAVLGDTIRLSEPVTRLVPAGGGWHLEGVQDVDQFDGVVLTLPAAGAAKLVRPVDAVCADRLSSIRCTSTAVVSFGFRRSDVVHSLNGYGYVIPASEGRLALACSWSSSKLSGRAPDDAVLMRVFLGRDGRSVNEYDDQALIDAAREELARTMGVTCDPLLEKLFRYPDAMPQYETGHLGRVAEIRARLDAVGGIQVAGCSYAGVGIPDCIRSGWQAADHLLESLQARKVPVDG